MSVRASVGQPVLQGEITPEGVISLLRSIESRRLTGVLAFSTNTMQGEVKFVAGQVAVDQELLESGDDPVEVVLRLREGTYVVEQRLPALPMSSGDAFERRGSLRSHSVPDLMSYCERAGLTGMLCWSREDLSVEAVYERGEVIGINFENVPNEGWSTVFAWDEGEFVISAFGEGTAVSALDNGRKLLKAQSMPIAELIEARERARPRVVSGPPLPASPAARARLESIPPLTPVQRETNVKLCFRSPQPAAEIAPIAKPSTQSQIVTTMKWAVIFLVLGVGLLLVLARVSGLE